MGWTRPWGESPALILEHHVSSHRAFTHEHCPMFLKTTPTTLQPCSWPQSWLHVAPVSLVILARLQD